MAQAEGRRLLLVEDDRAVSRAFESALARQGWTVETAANGRLAVERVKTTPFDVIVSDISMPEMNGLEFLRAVREQDLDVPVILIDWRTGA